MKHTTQALAAVDRLEELYQQSVASLREALKAYLETGRRPDPQARSEGLFAYPELKLTWRAENPAPRLSRAYARHSKPGDNTTTLPRPHQNHAKELVLLW